MNRQFYSLPEPGQVGLEWAAYEEGREKIARIVERHQEAQRAAQDLQRRIKENQDGDVRRLARAILQGKADPAVEEEALQGLASELREERRLREALEAALPEAEEELRRTVYENQAVWKSQADKVLLKAMEAEREAYERAREIAQKARTRRQYAEALCNWVRTLAPFNLPGDVTIASTVQQRWEEDLGRCERQMHERQRNEQLRTVADEEGGTA
jgi:hypothetical protein